MNTAVDWREEALGRHHDRVTFDCGVSVLNQYLQRYARQNHESGGAKTFVAVPPEMRGTSVSPGPSGHLPCGARTGLGGDLLLAAGERALAVAQEVGGVAPAIDAKDERAAVVTKRFGALRLLDDPLKLVLPLDTVRAALMR